MTDLELYAPSPSSSCLPPLFLLPVSPFLPSFSIPSWLNIYISQNFLAPISHSLLFWYTLETTQSPPLTLFSSHAMITRGFTICFPSPFPILYLLYLPSHTPTVLPILLNLLNPLPTTHPLSTKGSIFVPLLALPFYLPLHTASHSPASLTLFPNRSYSGKSSQVTPSIFTNYDSTVEGFLSLLASLHSIISFLTPSLSTEVVPHLPRRLYSWKPLTTHSSLHRLTTYARTDDFPSLLVPPFHFLLSPCFTVYSEPLPHPLKCAYSWKPLTYSHSLHQLLSNNRWLPLFYFRFSILFSPFALPYALRKPYLL